jgi:hypothetical protein
MLWFKAWLEIRWRFCFLAATALLVWFTPFWMPSTGVSPAAIASRLWVGTHLGTVLLYIFSAVYLAGSGINTQTTYAATSGFHGSMLFTLSLPVSRRRLLFARAELGAVLAGILIAIMASYTLYLSPGPVSALQAFAYIVRVLLCALPIYAVAVLLACLLDEMWQFMGACFIWILVFLMQSRFDVISRISPLRALSLICYPVTSPMPWAPIAASVVMAGAALALSVWVLERKEY